MTNEQMIEEILDKMNIINRGAIKAEEYNRADASAVKEIYDYVMNRSSLSISEVDGIVEELGQLT
ncbi:MULTISPECIES: DUF1128 family protein [Exiguobacterium]|jgi:uncharacterized protein YfkK (UPF0435 family)|uniref:Uncharacterized protein n=3 Tax=Exiguobacterium TaxID=33986 RepID=U1LGI9_9BACL|nr:MULTISPECIES: DUF1128 family protein [Exiguobacterium]ERG66468.1 hypothetical protein M467_04155 [Exiguobacterium chiriqhucha RW-2]KAB2860803.1 MAG: DUF1128 family protein [Exiguobacterium chiriqhucha]KGI85108.1 hypothetical protein JY98_02295 [Exiguobacterium mexicanum]MCT4777981.1 DUF1128 domain-containing protein [Exiguobacterium aquaticum]MCT4788003.1 DUF1128 domain-containing protein [Exiguobacterium mexicanum]